MFYPRIVSRTSNDLLTPHSTTKPPTSKGPPFPSKSSTTHAASSTSSAAELAELIANLHQLAERRPIHIKLLLRFVNEALARLDGVAGADRETRHRQAASKPSWGWQGRR